MELGARTESNLGVGCGNPVSTANLTPGETVLDLGSGAGFDCFLASRVVGPSGYVIGVDMTPEMLIKSRENAKRNNFHNVHLRLGTVRKLILRRVVAFTNFLIRSSRRN